MKKEVFSIFYGLIMAGVVFVAGEGAARAKPLEIMVAYANQPGEPVDQAVAWWARALEKASKGSIILEPFPSGQLGGEVVVEQQARMGAPILAIASYGALADLVPDLGVINAPMWVSASRRRSIWYVQNRSPG